MLLYLTYCFRNSCYTPIRDTKQLLAPWHCYVANQNPKAIDVHIIVVNIPKFEKGWPSITTCWAGLSKYPWWALHVSGRWARATLKKLDLGLPWPWPRPWPTPTRAWPVDSWRPFVHITHLSINVGYMDKWPSRIHGSCPCRGRSRSGQVWVGFFRCCPCPPPWHMQHSSGVFRETHDERHKSLNNPGHSFMCMDVTGWKNIGPNWTWIHDEKSMLYLNPESKPCPSYLDYWIWFCIQNHKGFEWC